MLPSDSQEPRISRISKHLRVLLRHLGYSVGACGLHSVVQGNQAAHRIGRFGVLRQHVGVTAATAHIFLLVGTTGAGLLDPARAVVAVEAIRVEPDVAQLGLFHVGEGKSRPIPRCATGQSIQRARSS